MTSCRRTRRPKPAGPSLRRSIDMTTGTLHPHAVDELAPDRERSAGTALWLFMGVATTFFTLFIVAYGMRMDAQDWSPITLPSQLWISTALLVVGSVLMQRAGAAAAAGEPRAMRVLLVGGG